MQRLTVEVPDEGRVTVSGEACTPQLSAARKPIESTLMGADDAAVVGSVTMMLVPVDAGWPALRAITPIETSNGTMTNGTGFESCA